MLTGLSSLRNKLSQLLSVLLVLKYNHKKPEIPADKKASNMPVFAIYKSSGE